LEDETRDLDRRISRTTVVGDRDLQEVVLLAWSDELLRDVDRLQADLSAAVRVPGDRVVVL